MENKVDKSLGRVGLCLEGKYDPQKPYHHLSVVYDDFGSYISRKDNNIGNPLSDTNWWMPQANAKTIEDGTKRANAAAAAAENASISANSAAESATLAAKRAEKAESDAKQGETGRQTAESDRVHSESSRSTAETGRVNNENTRVTNEQERASAESLRVSAESNRASEFVKIKSDASTATANAANAATSATNAANKADAATNLANTAAGNATSAANSVAQKITEADQAITGANDAARGANAAKDATVKAISDANTAIGSANAAAGNANAAADKANQAATAATAATGNMQKYITEYNVSKLYPTKGIGGTDKYDLLTAIAVLNADPAVEKSVGIKCSFVASDGLPQTYEYKGGVITDAASWRQLGAVLDGNVNSVLDEAKKIIDALSSQTPVCGFTRINGDVDPAAKTIYNYEQIKEIGKHLHLMVVKDGIVQKVAARGRLTISTEGEPIAIDGTEGDVMLGFDIPIHQLAVTKKTECGEFNMMGISLGPCVWRDTLSKEQPAFAITPWETVNCQLPGDTRPQAHCIYNKSANGAYAPAIDFFVEKIKSSGGGYPSLNVSGIDNLIYAQAKNADANSVFPYLGNYYRFEEIIRILMYAECQTLDTTALNMFGCGCTAMSTTDADTFYDNAISGNAGVKVIKTDGAESYFSLISKFKTKVSDGDNSIIAGISGTEYSSFFECGESVRVLDAIMAARLQGKIGVYTNIFTYSPSGAITCVTDGSINPSTGIGMVPGQKYYVVRNVPKCEGLADNVMTAVVNCYIKLTAKPEVVSTDGKTSYGGASFIFKLSYGVYRGWTIPLHCYRHISYAYYTYANDNGRKYFQFHAANSVYDIHPMIDKLSSGTFETKLDSLKGLTIHSPKHAPHNGWSKKGDYGMSLFYVKEIIADTHTHECMYLSFDYSLGNGNGQPNPGQVFVNSSPVGCSIDKKFISARSLFSKLSINYRTKYVAGAFAVLPRFKSN